MHVRVELRNYAPCRLPKRDPTEVGQKVGLSHNGVNRPTDQPGPQNRAPGQSRICPLHCGIEHGGVDHSPRSCSIANQLNPAPPNCTAEADLPLHHAIERGGTDVSPCSCSIADQLNPALNGESRLDKSRLSTMVAGARYAQRCPVEFGVPIDVAIAARIRKTRELR